MQAALERLVEQHARLRRVVVGEHHQRARAARIAGAGDQVDGRAAAAHEAAQDARPVLGLVDDAGEGAQREQRARRAPAAQHERGAGHPEQAEAGGGRRKGAPGGLVLERHLDARDGAQARGQPLGGLPLAGRAGRAVDRGERLDDLAQHALAADAPSRLRSVALTGSTRPSPR